MSFLKQTIFNQWNQFWFRPETTLNLDIIRMGVGFSMLFANAGLTAYVEEFYGNQGWVSQQAIYLYRESLLHQSLLFYLDDTQLIYVHYAFLLSCFMFAIGWKTHWVKWIVLILNISYAYRNPLITYGVESILSSVLFILCMAPIGKSFSVDRWLQVKRTKLSNLTTVLADYQSSYVLMYRRLLQIQMAIFFLFAGIEKLRGEYWWSGDALWVALNNYEYSNISLTFFAEHYWIINLLTYTTLILEIGYFFLIWQRSTRPWFLVDAILLHLCIGVFMGLYYFSMVMIFCHLSFIRTEWYSAVAEWWRTKAGKIEMIYDSDCRFCKHSMAWLLAFDGLKQITIQNHKISSSSLVSKEQVNRELFVVNDKDEKYAGFDAWRYVILRVPGLWWIIPFFYVPFFSKVVGRRVYSWVATNRLVVSE